MDIVIIVVIKVWIFFKVVLVIVNGVKDVFGVMGFEGGFVFGLTM